jgi:hypothetical protein
MHCFISPAHCINSVQYIQPYVAIKVCVVRGVDYTVDSIRTIRSVIDKAKAVYDQTKIHI